MIINYMVLSDERTREEAAVCDLHCTNLMHASTDDPVPGNGQLSASSLYLLVASFAAMHLH